MFGPSDFGPLGVGSKTGCHMAWILATLGGLLWIQKSPQGLCRAGFQDFSGQFWYRRERILVELAGVEPASEITTPSALHA